MNSQTELDLDTMITDLGALVAAVEIRAYPPNLWVIAINDTFAIEIEHLEAAGVLVLGAELGLAPAGQEADTYSLLLQANALWRETGGLHHGLDGATGMLTQTYRVQLTGLDLPGLHGRVQNFIAAALHWRAIIATPPRPLVDEIAPTENFTRV